MHRAEGSFIVRESCLQYVKAKSRIVKMDVKIVEIRRGRKAAQEKLANHEDVWINQWSFESRKATICLPEQKRNKENVNVMERN